MMRGTVDAEIRAALHAKKLGRLRHLPDTLIVDELGLAHAKVRIDVAFMVMRSRAAPTRLIGCPRSWRAMSGALASSLLSVRQATAGGPKMLGPVKTN